MMTKTETLIQAVDDYLAVLPTGTKPDLGKMEGEVLERTHALFDVHNSMCEKTQKWKKPDILDPICVAHILLNLFTIRKITYADGADGYLAIYFPDGENAGLYVEDNSGKNVLGQLIRRVCPGITTKNKAEVMDILQDKAEVIQQPEDPDPDLIAVNNGIFNFRTKELLPFSPDYVFTAKSRVNYVKGAANPWIQNPDDGTYWDVVSWMESLSDDPEIVELLWQIVGAVIRPHVRWDKIVLPCSSVGMNGKGTLCELMRQICGKESYISIPIEDFDKRFALGALGKCTAVITDENSTLQIARDPKNLKAAITGDPITVERKNENPFVIRFSGLIVQCVNEKPKFADRTPSLYRRFLMVPFNKTFQGRERKYIKSDYLHRQDVLEYVLCHVLNMDYYEFSEPAACKAMLAEYKKENDLIRQYADEILPQLKWDLVPWDFLYDLYQGWIAQNAPGAKVQSKITFMDNMKKILEDPAMQPGWVWKPSPISVTQNNMKGPEPLILEYGAPMSRWVAPRYSGNNPDHICRPALKASYRGIVRV